MEQTTPTIQQAWSIFVNGKMVTTVWTDPAMTAEEVRDFVTELNTYEPSRVTVERIRGLTISTQSCIVEH